MAARRPSWSNMRHEAHKKTLPENEQGIDVL
jgi:hypothetical protein